MNEDQDRHDERQVVESPMCLPNGGDDGERDNE